MFVPWFGLKSQRCAPLRTECNFFPLPLPSGPSGQGRAPGTPWTERRDREYWQRGGHGDTGTQAGPASPTAPPVGTPPRPRGLGRKWPASGRPLRWRTAPCRPAAPGAALCAQKAGAGAQGVPATSVQGHVQNHHGRQNATRTLNRVHPAACSSVRNRECGHARSVRLRARKRAGKTPCHSAISRWDVVREGTRPGALPVRALPAPGLMAGATRGPFNEAGGPPGYNLGFQPGS